MCCNGLKQENSWSKQKCKKLLAFSSHSCIEVTFLIASSSCNNMESLTNAKVEHLWDSFPLLPQNKPLGQLRGFLPGIALN